jgi:hypothetical protein
VALIVAGVGVVVGAEWLRQATDEPDEVAPAATAEL